MKKWFFLFIILSSLYALNPLRASAQQENPIAIVIEANGPVAPAMAEYIRRAIQTGEDQGAELVVIQLDTPGGSVDTMLEIVQLIRASQVPVVVYVAPEGAMAGSAGTVITLAGHFAVMAPETVIGAASPVGAQGEDLGETIAAKEKEAIRATIRSLMEGRRPATAISLAEETVETARAVTNTEALEAGMIDFVASSLPALLDQLDGRVATLRTGEEIIETQEIEVVRLNPSIIEQILAALTNPNIVFILLALGVQAILIELGSPGGWVAGFIGAVCLALASYGLGILEANWLGLIFLVIAFALFILDIKAPTHGALTAAGIGSFIVGALVLFNSPSTPSFQRVSVPLVIVMSLIIGGTFLVILMFGVRAQKSPIRVGKEALVGRIGIVQVPLNPEGIIRLGGENWSAELTDGETSAPRGTHVQVESVDGIRLKVRRSA